MNDVQLYLAIGIPTFSVILAWLANNRRFDTMDKRFDALDKHIATIESDLRFFYNVTGKMEGRMDAIEKRQG